MQNESQKNCNLKPLLSPIAEGRREESTKKVAFCYQKTTLKIISASGWA